MTQVMYRRPDGTVGVFAEAKGQRFLAADGWKPLNAKSLPYTSQLSGRLDNVSTALDHLLQAVGELSRDVEGADSRSLASAAESTSALASVKAVVSGLEQQVLHALKAVERDTHHPLSVSRSNNPALQFEPIGQTLRLDLTVAGSFDDGGAKLGVNSVQGALTRLATLIGDLRTDYYRVYNEAVTLSNRLADVERRLAVVEDATARSD